MRSQYEHIIQCGIARFLNCALPDDCIWYAIPNGGARDAVTGKKLKDEGVKAGAPDIVLVSRGQPIGLEVKTPKGRLSPEQKSFHEAAKSAGMPCLVVRSIEDVERVLVELKIPLKARVS